jgi:hypothetical protein
VSQISIKHLASLFQGSTYCVWQTTRIKLNWCPRRFESWSKYGLVQSEWNRRLQAINLCTKVDVTQGKQVWSVHIVRAESRWTLMLGMYVNDCSVICRDVKIDNLIVDLKQQGFNLKIECGLRTVWVIVFSKMLHWVKSWYSNQVKLATWNWSSERNLKTRKLKRFLGH